MEVDFKGMQKLSIWIKTFDDKQQAEVQKDGGKTFSSQQLER